MKNRKKVFNSIGIIGNGKFSRLVQKLIQYNSTIKLKVFSRGITPDSKLFYSFEETCNTDILIPAVPISAFKGVVERMVPHLREGQLIVDVCSVKAWSKKVLLEKIPKNKNIDFLCTHPNFGPESYRMNNHSTYGFNIIVDRQYCDKTKYKEVQKFLRHLDLNIVEMDADKHDKEIGVPHFVSMLLGLTLNKLKISPTEYGAASTQKMFDMAEGVGKDIGIVKDMYKYNPYCKDLISDLNTAIKEVSRIATDVD